MRSWLIAVLAAALLAVALLGARPVGDGAEYLLAARALGWHGTPNVRSEDVRWLMRREPHWRKMLVSIKRGMQADELTPRPSVRRAPNGEYYSLHFWLYSALAAPFLWVTELLRLRPLYALATVNALAATVACIYLMRPQRPLPFGVACAALFVASGTTFYLGWPGAEVLTASTTLIACLAAQRGQLGLGALAAGVAATQNPSAIFLLPFVAYRAGAPAWRVLRAQDRGFVAIGIGLAIVPYLFFFHEFRVANLIATFATDFSLISAERAWSFCFDLNEGMVMGVPGLLLGTLVTVVVAALTLRGPARHGAFVGTCATLLLAAGMAVPTFSIHNWNSGNRVMIRYAYWIAMPLLALCIEILPQLGARARVEIIAAMAGVQLAVITMNGLVGASYSYVRHTWAAKLVLRHFPRAYNPVPEIFYERSLGWEAPRTRPVVVWPYRGTPGKLMVRDGHAAVSERICANGARVESDHVRRASDGWTYLNPPFRCALRGGRVNP